MVLDVVCILYVVDVFKNRVAESVSRKEGFVIGAIVRRQNTNRLCASISSV